MIYIKRFLIEDFGFQRSSKSICKSRHSILDLVSSAGSSLCVSHALPQGKSPLKQPRCTGAEGTDFKRSSRAHDELSYLQFR